MMGYSKGFPLWLVLQDFYKDEMADCMFYKSNQYWFGRVSFLSLFFSKFLDPLHSSCGDEDLKAVKRFIRYQFVFVNNVFAERLDMHEWCDGYNYELNCLQDGISRYCEEALGD